MSEWVKPMALTREGPKGGEQKPAAPEPIDYGTHTLPRKFWTVVKEGENLLRSKAFLERRAAKNARHLDNKATKAEQNRRGKR